LHLARATEPFVPASLDLTALAESVITTLDPLAEQHQVALALETPDRTPVMGNDTLLGVAFSNLVENGILYNRPGGWVRVKMKVEGETVILQVQDNGVGIPPAAQPHIFARFFRANLDHPRTVPASGLGLAIAAEIVTHHRGTLSVTSIAGEGTTFTMRLPRLSVTV
jgi:signal transduction histidine kinase